MAAIRTSHSRAHAKSTLGKIQSVAHRSADAVVRHPADQRAIDSSLQHQIFNQLSDWILGERGDHCGSHPEASAQAAGDIVFPAALPGSELSRSMDAFFSGIKPQHYLAKADAVPPTTFGCF
jgi:hypothetical protein